MALWLAHLYEVEGDRFEHGDEPWLVRYERVVPDLREAGRCYEAATRMNERGMGGIPFGHDLEELHERAMDAFAPMDCDE